MALKLQSFKGIIILKVVWLIEKSRQIYQVNQNQWSFDFMGLLYSPGFIRQSVEMHIAQEPIILTHSVKTPSVGTHRVWTHSVKTLSVVTPSVGTPNVVNLV